MTIAITRGISPSMHRCELTHLTREEIDLSLAAYQHERYERLLSELGCELHRLPVEPDLPDSVFVEDAATVLDELAIITRPGAEPRRGETASVAKGLEPHRELFFIESPGTLDGGDVLCIEKVVFVGLTERSNRAGFEQLTACLQPYGYQTRAVEVNGCLHLKSAVTEVGPGTVLINRHWVDVDVFGDFELIDIDPIEPFAANALLVNEVVILPSGFASTRGRLESRGIRVRTVDVSELGKAEGGVTCCSLILKA
jgi:dimethylargininase